MNNIIAQDLKLYYELYSYLSDLGPHKDEAPMVDGIPDSEKPNHNDAFMGLSMTEDMLICLYQNQYENNNK